jgi:gas vesicle protein
MAKRSGGGAFFFGSVIGGAVGSLVALWKTPQSGKELRQKLGLESEPVTTVTAATKSAASTATDVARSAAQSATSVARTAAATATGAAKGAVDSAAQVVRHDSTSDTTTPAGTTTTTGSTPGSGIAGKALGLVEKAAAPLVGVKLGQTANNSQPGAAPVADTGPIPAATPADTGITAATTTSDVSPGLTPPGTIPVMPSGSK